MLHEKFLFSCIAYDDDDLQDFSSLQHYQGFSKKQCDLSSCQSKFYVKLG